MHFSEGLKGSHLGRKFSSSAQKKLTQGTEYGCSAIWNRPKKLHSALFQLVQLFIFRIGTHTKLPALLSDTAAEVDDNARSTLIRFELLRC